MYLDFARYQEIGGKLDDTDFMRSVITACAIIDSATFNRLRVFFTNPTNDQLKKKVEYLVYELIERGLIGSLSGSDIASQSSERLSISYESTANKASEIVRAYLQNESVDGVPLMYAGRV
jgi:hypothetical protein